MNRTWLGLILAQGKSFDLGLKQSQRLEEKLDIRVDDPRHHVEVEY